MKKKYIIKLWDPDSYDGSYYWRLYAYDPYIDEYLVASKKYTSPLDALDAVQSRMYGFMDYEKSQPTKSGEVLCYRIPSSPAGSYDATVTLICDPRDIIADGYTLTR